MNEETVVRSGTRYDRAAFRVNEVQSVDNVIDSDSRYTIQRMATGASGLEAEESDNTSFGVVLTPIDNLIVTIDTWTIEKDKTIGLFGRDNHTVLDLALLIENGDGNCTSSAGNSAVIRDSDELDDGVILQQQAYARLETLSSLKIIIQIWL